MPWRRRLLAPAVLSCLAVSCTPPAPDGPPLPASGRHRVQASGEAAGALLRSGATLVADYGAFRVLDASPSALQASAAARDVEYRNDFFRIALNSGDLDTALPPPKGAPRALATGAAGKALHLVQFAGPIRPEWLARLEATGVRVVSHVPANAYLVYGEAPALERLLAFAASAREVQFEGAYLAAHKLDPALAPAGPGSYAVQLVEDAAVNEGTVALAQRLGREPVRVSRALGYVNLVVLADRAAAEALAERPDVVSVQPWEEPRLLDERQDVIVSGQLTSGLPGGPGYLAWLGTKGFTQAQFDASAFGVDVTDSGIDAGTTLPNHFGLYRLGDVAGTSR
ncbi:MAG TPA: hemagglutinin, partial [Anaeromyxobacter sp.]